MPALLPLLLALAPESRRLLQNLTCAAVLRCTCMPSHLQDDLPAYARKKSRFHKGSCVGLKAWAVARLVEVKQPQGASKQRGNAAAAAAAAGPSSGGVPSKLLLQRFYRPEEISPDTAYRWDWLLLTAWHSFSLTALPSNHLRRVRVPIKDHLHPTKVGRTVLGVMGVEQPACGLGSQSVRACQGLLQVSNVRSGVVVDGR